MKILVLHGPNLNMLGYASESPAGEMKLSELDKALATYGTEAYEDLEFVFYQTNHEGQIIDMVQKSSLQYDGVILNPAALCHYSFALCDAVKLADTSVVEVHLDDLTQNDDARRHSLLVEVCKAQFMGKQLESYKEALDFLMQR